VDGVLLLLVDNSPLRYKSSRLAPTNFRIDAMLRVVWFLVLVVAFPVRAAEPIEPDLIGAIFKPCTGK
jgi:hypothetical protein